MFSPMVLGMNDGSLFGGLLQDLMKCVSVKINIVELLKTDQIILENGRHEETFLSNKCLCSVL